MSLIQNEIIEEMLYENGFCTKCMQEITKELKDDGTTQGEYEIEKGHLKDCTYYECEATEFGRLTARKIAEKLKNFDPIEHVRKNAGESRELPPIKTYNSDGTISYTARYKDKNGNIREGI